MVVRIVCVFRVPVCARVSCVSRLPLVTFYRYSCTLNRLDSAAVLNVGFHRSSSRPCRG